MASTFHDQENHKCSKQAIYLLDGLDHQVTASFLHHCSMSILTRINFYLLTEENFSTTLACCLLQWSCMCKYLTPRKFQTSRQKLPKNLSNKLNYFQKERFISMGTKSYLPSICNSSKLLSTFTDGNQNRQVIWLHWLFPKQKQLPVSFKYSTEILMAISPFGSRRPVQHSRFLLTAKTTHY